MVEQLRTTNWSQWITTVCAVIGAIGVASTAVAVLIGVQIGGGVTSHDVSQIKTDIQSLSAQLQRLQEHTASPDWMMDMGRRVSVLDGRLDGMDSRMRAAEERLTRALTQVEGITAASNSNLGTGKKN